MKTEQQRIDAVAKKWIKWQQCLELPKSTSNAVDWLTTPELLALQHRIKGLLRCRNIIALRRLGVGGSREPLEYPGQEHVSYESAYEYESRVARLAKVEK